MVDHRTTSSQGLPDNIASVACYLLPLVTGALFLTLPGYLQNRGVRFHAWQSILAWSAFILSGAVLAAVALPLAGIPLVGLVVVAVVSYGLVLGAFVLWLMLLVKTYKGETWRVPVLAGWAEKWV